MTLVTRPLHLLLAVLALLAPVAGLQAGEVSVDASSCYCCPEQPAAPAVPACVEATPPGCCCVVPGRHPVPQPVPAPARSLADDVGFAAARELAAPLLSPEVEAPRLAACDFGRVPSPPVRELFGVRLI